MFSQALKRTVLTIGAAAVTMGLGISSASATAVPFTWYPFGSTPSLSTPGAPFTADSFALADFAHIHINTAGAFTEQGVLQIGSFKLGASTVSTPGLNSAIGGTSYQIYATFSATGSIGSWPACAGGGFCLGSFSSLTYDLWGDVGGNAAYSFVGLTPTVTTFADTIIHLASGSLLTGCGADCLNLVTLAFGSSTSVSPGAFVSATFDPDALQSGFFVAPSIVLDLQNSFTNTNGVTTLSSACATALDPGCRDIKINNGGGNANFFSVPEPGSLLLLGSGLVGWAGFSRRRRSARA